MVIRALVAIATTIFIAFTPCTVRAQGADADADLAQRIDQAIQRATLGQFWGGILVARNGQVLLCKGYGVANDKLDPITDETLFDVGSITKMFTAAAVLRLESLGKLSTSDTIETHFPGRTSGAGPAAAAGAITIQQLLTHTSGKSDSNGAIQPLDFEDRDEAVRLFLRSKPASKPGQKFEYCNGGYIVLAAIVEKVSGKDYESAIRELVLTPAGMTHSGFLDGAGLDASKQTMRITSGRGGSRRGLMLDKNVEPWAWGLRGAGGLVTSMRDLLAFDAAIRDGKVLDATAAEKWLTPGTGDYACGWFVENTEEGRLKQHHSGSTRGYICEIARYPAEGVFIAVLANENVRHLGFGLTDAVAAALWPSPTSTTSVTLEFVKDLLGQHNEIRLDQGVTIEAAAADGSVILTAVRDEGKIQLLRAVLNRPAAQQLAHRIATTLKSGQHAKTPDGGTEFGIFGFAYNDRLAAGQHTIEVAAASWDVMPSYSGIGENGKPIRDNRLVITMSDGRRPNFWPVMIKADDADAERIRKAIEAAVEQLK